jgi:hypothetical protein
VLHELPHVFSKLLHLLGNILGTGLDVSDNDSDLLDVWDLEDLLFGLNSALGLIATLMNDVGEVRRTTTVPCKVL